LCHLFIKGHCAVRWGGGGGWWFRDCSYVSPTAVVGGTDDGGPGYMFWGGAFDGDLNQALKSLTLKLKPVN